MIFVLNTYLILSAAAQRSHKHWAAAKLGLNNYLIQTGAVPTGVAVVKEITPFANE
jgi:hypothetical protein